MGRNLPVRIVNNAPRAVTFERQSAGNVNRGTIILESGKTHCEPGPNMTYEKLMLKDPTGNLPDQLISMDELADDHLEKIEVDHNFQLVRHQRKTLTQKISDLNPFKSRSRGDTLPT